MTDRCPLPARASFRDLLRDLIGVGVQVRNGTPQELSSDRPSYLAGYRFDDGGAAAVVVTDGALSLAAASALSTMTLGDEEDLGQDLDGDLLDFFHEVVNINAKLLNSPTTPHVRLQELLRVPGEVPGDLAEVASRPSRREDWHVHIEGFGDGTLTLLG